MPHTAYMEPKVKIDHKNASHAYIYLLFRSVITDYTQKINIFDWNILTCIVLLPVLVGLLAGLDDAENTENKWH